MTKESQLAVYVLQILLTSTKVMLGMASSNQNYEEIKAIDVLREQINMTVFARYSLRRFVSM